MARRRRVSTLFNLSFLDVMTAGFGAVVLVLLLTKHSVNERVEEVNADLMAEVARLERDVSEGRANLVELTNALEETEKRIEEMRGRARRVTERIEDRRGLLADLRERAESRQERAEELRADLEELRAEREKLAERAAGEQDEGRAAYTVTGEGRRQYLTGLRVGGERVLLLVDSSASMLEQTIVNVIRRRNMSVERQRKSPKWQRTLGTAEWLAAQMPLQSRFQLYTFAEEVKPMIAETRGQWLDVSGGPLDSALGTLRDEVPAGGTNLRAVFQAVGELSPLPDNIYLITDGLPTLGKGRPRGSTVSGEQRLRRFNEALDALPPGIPVNVVLFPLEGDPMAPSSYWRLAISTGGSFMSPSEDWP